MARVSLEGAKDFLQAFRDLYVATDAVGELHRSLQADEDSGVYPSEEEVITVVTDYLEAFENFDNKRRLAVN